MVMINIIDKIEFLNDNKSGHLLFNIIKSSFERNEQVTISFAHITEVSSSFVNSAFIELLRYYNFSYIRKNLHFKDTNRQINNIIKRRFAFETEEATVY